MSLRQRTIRVRAGRALIAAAGLWCGVQGWSAEPVPEWIWHPNDGAPAAENEVRWFRRVVRLDQPVKSAELLATADNHLKAWVNGARVLKADDWNRAAVARVGAKLRRGENVIAFEARNDGGVAGLIARLTIEFGDGSKRVMVTDASWRCANKAGRGWREPGFMETGWMAAKSLGQLGMAPWGDVLTPAQATPVSRIQVAEGFRVELLHSAQPGEGSWICMATDGRGRLIISPQSNDDPLLRVTLDAAGQVARIEPMRAPVHQAMGLLWSHESLYANAYGPQGIGLYRLIDANHDDHFDADETHLLKKFHSGGEHGYHAVAEGPDGMIYVLNGNHTHLPEGLSPESPHRHYAEDQLLPRQWDANGHAVGVLSPGGYVLRTDPEGREWKLMLAGFRNTYDFAFGPDGELFTFDADMEWDWGLPWYRPTRVNHCVSGAEFGWRSGSGKWPPYYPDSLPAVVDIGIGSPTGVLYGQGTKFPQRYQRALFIEDWSYGRIFAVHLRPDGATYDGSFETILRGKPLNLTDLVVGPDGAIYFTTGGRGTQSGLYRLSWVGPAEVADDAPDPGVARAAAEARDLRHRLEQFHGRRDPRAVETAWPYLGHPDRWIRYAARIAIEAQDPATWAERALAEREPEASLTALLALARCGSTLSTNTAEVRGPLLAAWRRLDFDHLAESQQLAALRVLEVAFIRLGVPTVNEVYPVAKLLDAHYPASSWPLNRELSQLLIYLNFPGVIGKTLDLMDAAPTQEEQIHYLFHLRTLQAGWTLEQRERYFGWWGRDRSRLKHPPELVPWFTEVDRAYSDGASFNKYLANIRRDAAATLSTAERAALGPVLQAGSGPALPQPSMERKFVRQWTMADFPGDLDEAHHNRDFERGRQAFIDVQCLACHRFGNLGGSVGPELGAVASKYSTRDLLSSILEPSKVVSDQYQSTTLILADEDDDMATGRILDEDDEKVVVLVDALNHVQREVPKSKIIERRPSQVSAMPEGLVVILTRDEILDLLAYLESGGRQDAPVFKKRKR